MEGGNAAAREKPREAAALQVAAEETVDYRLLGASPVTIGKSLR
jgi:hypothetical protein